MEGGKGLEQKVGGTNEVVVLISGAEEPSKTMKQSENSVNFASGSYPFSKNTRVASPNIELTDLERLKPRVQLPPLSGSSSPGITMLSPTSPNNIPRAPDGTVLRRRPMAPSAYSKPKSRLVEPSYRTYMNLADKSTQRMPAITSSPSNIVNSGTPKENIKTAPITPRTPLMASPGGGEYDDEDENDDQVYKIANPQNDEKSGKKLKVMVLIEWIAFVCIMGVLIAGLTIERLQKRHKIWGLVIWKWSVLVLVIFCGRLVTEWCINLLVFLIERHFFLKTKILYFVYALKTSVRVFIWFGFILLAWGLLIRRGANTSMETSRVLNYITRALASSLIGTTIWIVKTLLVKLLASSFHVKRFFDKIQESFFHQYVLHTLSGLPLREYAGSSIASGQLSFKSPKKRNQKEKEEVIDVDKLQKMRREKVSAWTMGGLVKIILSSGLSTISDTLEESVEQREITSEWEAKAAALRIFNNVAKPGTKFIDEEDLLRFLTKNEVDNVFLLFEGGTETGKIKRSRLRKWVVKVYNERKYLAHSLNDTETVIDDLNKIVSVIILIVIIIVWLLLMGIATTEILIFVSSQLLLLGFIFGNTFKTVFEAIIFVFVTHPFDVGDRCVIDGSQMVVEEMNILTTVFLKNDNEKIIYPNALLAIKPISNFNRSPEMSDSVEFAVDVSTSAETLVAFKAKIKAKSLMKVDVLETGDNVCRISTLTY